MSTPNRAGESATVLVEDAVAVLRKYQESDPAAAAVVGRYDKALDEAKRRAKETRDEHRRGRD